MENDKAVDWFLFHFGSDFVKSPVFNSESIYGKAEDCYVLFADFCSFTSFLKATDKTNSIENEMTSLYSEMRKIILQHNGMLDKFIGDAAVAIWGLHHPEENATEQILSACKELVQMANAIANEWQSHIDTLVEPKGMHIGLSKGDVLVIRRDKKYPGFSLLGNPLNLASRLQTAALPNQVVCSNVVYQDMTNSEQNLFSPYTDKNGDAFLEAKNYGKIKAWVFNIQP
jgi:class 3 adenylate cyclase